MATDGEADVPSNKVARVIRERGIDAIGDEIVQQWQTEGADGASVRELTESFNKRLLKDTLVESGVIPLEGEVETIYQQLVGNENGSAKSLQVRNRLDTAGIDGDALKQEFVSHQTMYRYLTDVRGVEKQTSTPTLQQRKESVTASVRKLQNRLSSVVTSNLETLAKRERFHVGDIDVTVSVTVTCQTCQTSKGLFDIIADNGCDCQDD